MNMTIAAGILELFHSVFNAADPVSCLFVVILMSLAVWNFVWIGRSVIRLTAAVPSGLSPEEYQTRMSRRRGLLISNLLIAVATSGCVAYTLFLYFAYGRQA